MRKKWFGDNWVSYVKRIDSKSLKNARNSLLSFLPEKEWEGKTLADVGCGSGIFSLSALLMGAGEVISFDVDPKSVEATKLTRETYGKKFADKWLIKEGSVLDDELVKQMEESADIVYAWGSLHHTGNMATALRNAGRMVKPGGHLVIAIYNRAPTSKKWLEIKKDFDELPDILKGAVEVSYACLMTIGFVVKRRTLNLQRGRGMNVFNDAIDWLRGYPYEYACVDEIEHMMAHKGFKLVKTPTSLSCSHEDKSGIVEVLRGRNTGCNEFVFRKH